MCKPLLLVFLFFLQCSTNDSGLNSQALTLQLETEHFKFVYTSLDKGNIQSIANTIEDNWVRITTNLAVSAMPRVTITLYNSPEALRDGVRNIVPNLPLWASGLATSVSQIHMLSPNHPSQNFNGMVVNITHEFAHCVTLKIKSNFGNNPRWLWESVAIHQAGQFVDPKQLSYMVSHTPPSLSELNLLSNTFIYSIGYLFTEFIITKWDYSKLNQLIIANGDTQSVLGLSPDEFYSQWFDFVKLKYGI